MALLSTLVRRGPSHAKSLRLVQVWHEITAPRFWWQEFATYRIGVEVSSASTMHTIQKRLLVQEDFVQNIPAQLLADLNTLVYAVRTDRKYLYDLKNLLPEGFLQKRIVMASYQALRAIYLDRVAHYLPEWKVYCEFIKTLPEAEKLILGHTPLTKQENNVTIVDKGESHG